MAESIDLTRPRRIHLVGIGGSGISAIATVLVGMGHRVAGSDAAMGPVLERLAALGVTTHVGHRAESLDESVELVAASTAVPADNPELVEARRRGLPVLRRAELLAAMCAVRPTVAVAGTHGKTTTSSLTTLALAAGGVDPSFLIGAEVAGLGAAGWNAGEWFVVEADESDGTFLELPRRAAVVTNVEPDHLEHYGGWPALQAAFDRFVTGTEGPTVICLDDPEAAALAVRARAAGASVVTYGLDPTADLVIERLESTADSVSFVASGMGGGTVVRVPAPGLHHARNAAAAVGVAVALGVEPGAAAEGIAGYQGVARRYEFRGEVAGVRFVDDYAHLPTEVRAALDAARRGGHGRVVAVFQPHRYSRTEAVWRDFADAFTDADLLVVTDVYPSGEAPRPGVTGHLIVGAVLDAHPRQPVAWMPRLDDVVAYLGERLRPGDLCLTLGAGDLTAVPDRLVSAVAAVAARSGGARS